MKRENRDQHTGPGCSSMAVFLRTGTEALWYLASSNRLLDSTHNSVDTHQPLLVHQRGLTMKLYIFMGLYFTQTSQSKLTCFQSLILSFFKTSP